MLKPDYLTVPELAERWGQGVKQILFHALNFKFRAYFLFDGIVSNYGAPRPINHIEEHTLHQEYQEEIYGLLRLTPRHLFEILDRGKTLFPNLAYHPEGPLVVRKVKGQKVLDGPIMKLSPPLGRDTFLKAFLAADDVLVLLTDVHALEERNKQPPANKLKKREPFTKAKRADPMRLLLEDLISEMESEEEKVTAATVMHRLRKTVDIGECVVDICPKGVIWEQSSGQPKTLTMDALKKRLQAMGYPKQGRVKGR
ncbi:hypothetical protein [Nitrosococcus wardiae]|uniref:Uncharacterized protein n=1 Tax=Nitrosococcus wardiae TaxID=1814290 RepID=A0A4P7BYS6_9GAMM|nr:hypothetical protein [Nitrosococcus wardiae]QBQ54330.1 hypothetical protein E3U44_07260 [Nitrosococcus wardiae]